MNTKHAGFVNWLHHCGPSLNAMYRIYRERHDYSPDGTYWATFTSWAYERFCAEFGHASPVWTGALHDELEYAIENVA